MKRSEDFPKFTKNDLLNLQKRRMIYQFILKNPGKHFREICRKLNASTGTINYHTRYLEKQGLITTKRNTRYRLYYAINKYGKEEENLLHNIKFEASRNILFYLIVIGSATQIELSKELKKHPTTIEFHLKRLVDLDFIELAENVNSTIHLNTKQKTIVSRDKIGREKFYRLKNPGRLYDLLISYYKNKYYKSDVADAFFYFIEDISNRESDIITGRYKTFKQATDDIEEMFYELFPNPFCC